MMNKIMQCCKCHGTINDESKPNAFYPIDPKGTEDRRWACKDCITPEEKENGSKWVPGLRECLARKTEAEIREEEGN